MSIIKHFEALEVANKLPSFEDLEQMATKLYWAYSTTKGYHKALIGLEEDESWWLSIVPQGSDWDPTEGDEKSDLEVPAPRSRKKKVHCQADQESAPKNSTKQKLRKTKKLKEKVVLPFKGDRILATSIAFMQAALLQREATEAITNGDIGRFYEIYKVRFGYRIIEPNDLPKSIPLGVVNHVCRLESYQVYRIHAGEHCPS
jgi:hypothetical protein